MATLSEVATKVCSACRENLPLSAYYNVRYSWCKECYKSRGRERTVIIREVREAKRAARPRSRTRHLGASSPPLPEGNALHVMSNPLIPGMVKIGRANCPETRAQNLSNGHPFHVQVEYTYEGFGHLEANIHIRIRDANVQGGAGREWFYMLPQQADTIIRGVLMEFQCAAQVHAVPAQAAPPTQEALGGLLPAQLSQP